MGLHTGTPERTTEGYVGMDVHLAARVAATGHGGQIVISDATRTAMAGATDNLELSELGVYRLKGVPDTVRLFQVGPTGGVEEFPPIRAKPEAVP
jgi:class 3 adenylate cyclase